MTIKRIKSPGYNLHFDTETGFMARWGVTKEEDPQMCPWGPEIADIEISTICNGVGKTMDSRVPCSFCYKTNTGVGTNMSLDTFKTVLSKLNPSGILTQIAFGIGDIDANPDLWAIMQHCRDNDVVPNITVNGMVEASHLDKLAHYCGAVAVSHYGLDDICFNTIKGLTDRGLKQVNIHKLLSKQTYKSCFKLIEEVADAKQGKMFAHPGLKELKAIVFLLLKPKGDRNNLDSIVSLEDYGRLVDYARKKGVAVGMDSCSAPMVLKTMPEEVIPSVEPCESTLFSVYVNVDGEMFPCSFTEGTRGWETGIDLKMDPVHGEDPWYNPRIEAFRKGLLASSSGCTDCSVQKHCRSCPVYDVTICQPKPELQANEGLVRLQKRAS